MDNIDARLLPLLETFEDFEGFKLHGGDAIQSAVMAILAQEALPVRPLKLFSEGTNIVFGYGDSVIKIFPPFHQDQFQRDFLILQHLPRLSVEIPTLQHSGEISGWPYLIMSHVEGTLLETLWESMPLDNKRIILTELGTLIKQVHSVSTEGLESLDCHWDDFLSRQVANCPDHHRSQGLPENLLLELPGFLTSTLPFIPKITRPVLLTGEYTPMNLLVQKGSDDMWHLHGLIDFGDAMLGLPQYDLLGPGVFLIQGNSDLLRTFLLGYGYLEQELNKELSLALTALTLLHQYSNLSVQVRVPNWQSQVHSLDDLANLVWGTQSIDNARKIFKTL